MDKNKILFICGESDNVVNFRKELILFLLKRGYLIDLVCADNIREKEILSWGVNSVNVFNFRNRSKNPFQLMGLTKFVKRVIKNSKPDYILSFQAKPNVATSRAIKIKDNPNFYCFLEGIGSVFDTNNIKQRLLSILVSNMYKKCFKKAKKVFVLNNDDKLFLSNRKLVDLEKLVVINGIGIDCGSYKPSDSLPKEKNVVMLSRLVKEKGVIEFAEIARLVRKTRKDISFYLYGQESDLKVGDIQKYIDSGDILFGNYCRNVRTVISNCRILALPSYYREGLPRSILESMALKRAAIAYDNVGSRDVVFDGETGYLIEPHNRELFANKIVEIIDNDDLLIKLGNNARLKCETIFSSEKINNQILDIIK